MYSSHYSSVVFNQLSLSWPDGGLALSDITGAFSTGKTGLIGANGSGKSTLLKLIDGQLKPTKGPVETAGRVGSLPQELSWRPGALVADVLNIAEPLNALKAIENGSIKQDDYDTLDGQWDIQARAESALGHLGISSVGLDRRAETLSGGELMLAALAGLHLAECDIVLLDEPTNNLDLRARHLLYEALSEWKGTVIIASHDMALLDLMGQTAELYQGSLRVHGGNYSSYRQVLALEQAGAEQELRTAKQKQKIEERQRQEAQTKLARRRRYADKDYENKRRPKTIMKQRGAEAQVSAGRLRGIHETKTSAAACAAQQARDSLRDDSAVRIQLPDPHVPTSKRLLQLRNADQVVAELRGPRKIALAGANGVGKSQMIKRLVAGRSSAKSGQLRVFTDRIGYLPQRLVFEDEQLSALDFVKLSAPYQPQEKIQAQLARFLMRGAAMNRELKVLSGGERFRVKLASLLLAEPEHQLLILDEPTNNLDVETVDALVSSLNGYCGGILVVSHDEAFLNRLDIQIWAELTEGGFKLNAS